MHSCRRGVCSSCWEEAKVLGTVLTWLGVMILISLLMGCQSAITSDCKRDSHGMWRCTQR